MVAREEIIRKVRSGELSAADLDSPEALAVAEEALQEMYPGLDLSKDPAEGVSDWYYKISQIFR